MRVVAQLMSLMMAGPTVMVWAQSHPGRCVADCQAMTSSMGTPCSEFKTGKPFKACGWSHREGVKDACRQLCGGTDRRELSARVDKACNNARQAIPKPTMHKACVTGYQGAFKYVSSVNDEQVRRLIGGAPIEEMAPPKVEEKKPEGNKMPKESIPHRQEKNVDTIEVMGKKVEMMGKKEKVETVEKKVEEKVVPEVPKSKPVEQPKAPAEAVTKKVVEERKTKEEAEQVPPKVEEKKVPVPDQAQQNHNTAAVPPANMEKRGMMGGAGKKQQEMGMNKEKMEEAAMRFSQQRQQENNIHRKTKAAPVEGGAAFVHEPARDLKAPASSNQEAL